MKVTEYIEKSAGKTMVSFEILPPLKGGSMDNIFKMLDPLMEFNPPFVDVTYHREEFLYQMQPSGYYQKVAIRKRPGTVGICSAIMHRYGIDAVPHLICGGFTAEDTENALIDLNFLNVQNVLALRGDARKFEDQFVKEDDGHEYASDLIRQIDSMNRGIYLDSNIENGAKTDFCIGVAGYPEKHYEAPNMETDLMYLKAKVDAGAHYIVTQMFFDNQVYYDFVKACRNIGIQVPIIPGIKPITKMYQLSSIPRNFFVNLPSELVKEARKATTDKEIRDVGTAWCIAQAQDLKKNGVPCIHFYTMSDSSTVKKICSKVV